MAETEETPKANATQPTAYVLPADLAQALLNYLALRPYGEVFQLINGVMQLEAAETETEE